MPPLPGLPVRAIEGWSEDDLRDFAREYGEAVREACAKVCEAKAPPDGALTNQMEVNCALTAISCAAAIRGDEK